MQDSKPILHRGQGNGNEKGGDASGVCDSVPQARNVHNGYKWYWGGD